MTNPQLNKAAVEQLLAQASESAVWWLCVWHEPSSTGRLGAGPRKGSLVLETTGQRQEYTLHNATCASLINRVAKGETFATPHLSSFAYDDYELIEERQKAAAQLWNSGSPLVEQLCDGMYYLDDTAGLPRDAAQAWMQEAATLLAALKWDELLWEWRRCGPPNFEVNSRVLLARVAAAAAELQVVRDFLQRHPLPSKQQGYAGPLTTGAGTEFIYRVTLAYLSKPTGFEDNSRYAQYQVRNMNWVRQEREMEAAFSASESATQPRTAATRPDAQRMSIRRRLLDIRSQIDELLSDMDDLEEFNRFRPDDDNLDEY